MFSKIIIKLDEKNDLNSIQKMLNQDLLWSAVIKFSGGGRILEMNLNTSLNEVCFVISSGMIPFSFLRFLNETVFPNELIEIFTNSQRKIGYLQWQSDSIKFSWFSDKNQDFICDIFLREFVNHTSIQKDFPNILIPRTEGLGNAISLNNWRTGVDLTKIQQSKENAIQFSKDYYVKEPKPGKWFIIPDDHDLGMYD